MAETVKLLADNAADATVIIVGVAITIDELWEQHPSIDRALVQIRMPRMSASEIRDLVQKGLQMVWLGVDADELDMIVWLSRGLPHYAHLLGLHSGRSAIAHKGPAVDLSDVKSAIDIAIERSSEAISIAVRACHLLKPRHHLRPSASRVRPGTR